jgi:hypothetical protein
VKPEYHSLESQQERKPGTDPAGYRRQAASRCAIASAVLVLAGGCLIGLGTIADGITNHRGEIAEGVGGLAMVVGGLFFIGSVVASLRKY